MAFCERLACDFPLCTWGIAGLKVYEHSLPFSFSIFLTTPFHPSHPVGGPDASFLLCGDLSAGVEPPPTVVFPLPRDFGTTRVDGNSYDPPPFACLLAC